MRDKTNKLLKKNNFRSADRVGTNETTSNSSFFDSTISRSTSSNNDDGFGSSENYFQSPISDEHALLKINLKSYAVECNDGTKVLEKKTFNAKKFPSSKQIKYKYSKQHDDKPSKQKDTRLDFCCMQFFNNFGAVLKYYPLLKWHQFQIFS